MKQCKRIYTTLDDITDSMVRRIDELNDKLLTFLEFPNNTVQLFSEKFSYDLLVEIFGKIAFGGSGFTNVMTYAHGGLVKEVVVYFFYKHEQYSIKYIQCDADEECFVSCSKFNGKYYYWEKNISKTMYS